MRHVCGVVGALVLLAGGCSGGDSAAGDPAGEPPPRTGEVVRVDACKLVARRALRRAVGEPVRVVGRELDPPTLPTESCLWGREFGVALVEVQVTPGPVAADTFEAAFGPAAGDDPREVDVGEAAYAREGLTSRTLQAFDNGVVLSVEARDSPGDRLPRRALDAIATAVLDNMPANPELADADPPRPCSRVDERAVAAAMGAEVRLRSAHVQDGSAGSGSAAMCSWAGLPGHVVVTTRTDPVQITNFRANLSPRVYERVPQVPAEAWSQDNHAGDLLIFVDDALVEVTALPGEGFSSEGVPTTPGEVRLAKELVRTLG
ncbi:MAG TPA: hypothetical protein VHG70_08025 [Nocardioidaceae bacterium]|nr:hypothetical protein [Nocardioidaceae bacterium]